MADGNVTVDRFSPSGRALLGCRCSPRFAEANFVDGESRAIERVGRKDGGIAAGRDGEISRNGGQKVRARSEKSGVGVLGRSGRITVAAAGENEMFSSRNEQIEGTSYVGNSRTSFAIAALFFLKKTGGKLKERGGKTRLRLTLLTSFFLTELIRAS